MVTRWGMSERVGMVQLAPRQNPYLAGPDDYAGYGLHGGVRPFSEETARTIDAEVRGIIGESHDEARRLLTKYRKQLDVLADALLTRETLVEQEILDVTGLSPADVLEQVANDVRDNGSEAAADQHLEPTSKRLQSDDTIRRGTEPEQRGRR